jgi:MFS family permease
LNRHIITKVAWRLMPTVVSCCFFAYFDRINIGFAKFRSPDVLTWSDAAYRLGASLFVIGYLIVKVPSSLLRYRFGARTWLARIIISRGVSMATMVFDQTPWQFCTFRFLIREGSTTSSHCSISGALLLAAGLVSRLSPTGPCAEQGAA